MEEFNNNYRRKRSKWASMWLMIGRLKLSIIFIVILVAIIASAYLVRSCRGNEATVYVDDKIDITPTQVLAMKEIGEWEFLSIENEEMIDTVRKGFFKDDELIRIYYGTLRLGFDMSEAKADWIKAEDKAARRELHRRSPHKIVLRVRLMERQGQGRHV